MTPDVCLLKHTDTHSDSIFQSIFNVKNVAQYYFAQLLDGIRSMIDPIKIHKAASLTQGSHIIPPVPMR